MANISAPGFSGQEIARLLSLLGQPARIQILLIISEREACVCHMEAVLGMRQASISQHLMVLRKAGLVEPCREGRNIFYRLARPEVVTLLHLAAQVAGIAPEAVRQFAIRPVESCPCPQCIPEANPVRTCGNSSKKTS